MTISDAESLPWKALFHGAFPLLELIVGEALPLSESFLQAALEAGSPLHCQPKVTVIEEKWYSKDAAWLKNIASVPWRGGVPLSIGRSTDRAFTKSASIMDMIDRSRWFSFAHPQGRLKWYVNQQKIAAESPTHENNNSPADADSVAAQAN